MSKHRDPWDLNPKHLHTLVLAGCTPEEIESLREHRREAYHALRAELYGEDVEEEVSSNHFYEKYGFEHVCTCVDDRFTNHELTVPVCRVKLGDDALEALEKVNIERDYLAERVDELRHQVLALGGSLE